LTWTSIAVSKERRWQERGKFRWLKMVLKWAVSSSIDWTRSLQKLIVSAFAKVCVWMGVVCLSTEANLT